MFEILASTFIIPYGCGYCQAQIYILFSFILGEYVLTICRYMLLWVHVREETTNQLGRENVLLFVH